MTNQTNMNDAFNKWLKENYPDYPPPLSEVWQAATKASESEINSLKERVAELQSHLSSQSIEIAHNDVTLESYAHKVTELQAHVNQLQGAGQAVVERWDSPNWSDGTHTRDYIDALRKALSSTPAQSLAQHDNEVIERCAKVCDYYAVNAFNSSSRNAAIELAVAIRNIQP